MSTLIGVTEVVADGDEVVEVDVDVGAGDDEDDSESGQSLGPGCGGPVTEP